MTAAGLTLSTLSATPTPSTTQAIANARALPQRRPSQVHNATDGAAARPTTGQTSGSTDRSAGAPLTSVDMNVAVIT